MLRGRDYSGILAVAFVHGLYFSFSGNIEQQTKTKLTSAPYLTCEELPLRRGPHSAASAVNRSVNLKQQKCSFSLRLE